MSLLNTFDPQSTEFLRPDQHLSPKAGFPPVVVATFSDTIAKAVLSAYPHESLTQLFSGRTISLYKLHVESREIAFYHSPLGGSAAAAVLEEILTLGGKRILFFGSCGLLDTDLKETFLLPTAAYRDEGVSYHYAPAADYIEISTEPVLARIFRTLELPFAQTKTWTTDAIYRETRNNIQKRTAEGCGVVEMECASLAAVAQYRNASVYHFFYAAPTGTNNVWADHFGGQLPASARDFILKAAVEVALCLCELPPESS